MAIHAVKRLLKAFRSAENGNIAAIASLAMLPVVAVVGASVDLDRAQSTETALQHIVDTAVLAGAKTGSIADASNVASANSASLRQCAPQFTFEKTSGGGMSGHAKCDVETAMMSLFRIDKVPVNVTAMAASGAAAPPACLVSLDARASRALDISGKAKIDLSGCDLLVNSSSPTAVRVRGSAEVIADGVCVVGGSSGLLGGLVGGLLGGPSNNCQPRPNGFPEIASGVSQSCDHNRFKAKKNATLSPGRYCNGLKLSNGHYELEPGVYVIDGGDLKLSGMKSLIGEGVTFYLTGQNVALDWSTSGNINLSAPTTGPLAGYVVYLDPNARASARSKWTASGGINIRGGIYLPGQELKIAGSGDFTGKPLDVAIAAGTLDISGSATIKIEVSDALKQILPSAYGQPAGEPRLM